LFSGLERRLTTVVSGGSIASAAAKTRFSLTSSMPVRYRRKVAGGLGLPQDRRAEIRARLPKETELSFLVAIPAKPIDFRSNSEYA
jgi:hypothetical protein